jgi:multidrug efflux pump subunit AcrB
MSDTPESSDDTPTMRGPIAWMADNSVAANLLMAVLLVGGLVMAFRVKQEVFPTVELDVVTVQVPYPGASPEEVEQGVVMPVEEAVREVEGVDEISSVSNEGVGSVQVELLTSTNPQRALNDVKSAVDRITSFPEDAEEPEISLVSNRQQVVSIIIYGDVDRHTLKELGERARDDLLADDRISVVDLTGLPPPEISIEIPQENLRRYDLTMPQVARIVRNASIDLPGGSVKTDGGEVLVRTTERRKFGSEFDDITVRATSDGTRVTLADVAEIEDTFRDTDRSALYNGKRAVEVKVYRVGNQTPLGISKAVNEYVEIQKQRMPDTVSYAIWNDSSEVYEDRIGLLLENSYVGLGLVLLILGLFLQIRLAFWVTLGIPISFLGAILFMPSIGVSINMISLFAFILTLGIVVDDAIVVGEAIFNAQSEERGELEAAVEGTYEVATPVVFAVLTTVTAFAPMLFVPGVSGEFFKNIPMIVIPIFLISLVEVLFILPAHLAHSNEPRQTGILGAINRAQKRFSDFVERFIRQVYQPFVRATLRYRYLTLSLSFSVLLLTIGIVGGGFISFTFLPKIEGDRVIASVQMPFGTDVRETRRVTRKLVDSAQTVLDASGGREKLSKGILADIGQSGGFQQGPGPGGASQGSHLTSVAVSLVAPSERDLTAAEFSRRWREEVGAIAGADTVDFSYSVGPSTGAPVSIELRHEQLEILRRASGELADAMRQYAGVVDVNDGFQRGKQQLDLTLKPEARALGLDETDLAQQVRGSFFGTEAYRVQRGRDELRVYVRRPESERDSIYHIRHLMLRTPNGGEIPLYRAAHVERNRAATDIQREGGARVIDVTADVQTSVTTGNEVTGSLQDEVLPDLLAKYPDLSYELSGEQQDQQESLSALGVGFAFALLVMFGLMAVVFRSYVQPLLIMIAIPFGFVGALAGHLLMGFKLSMISFFGLIALSGVVVNDSLVLIAAVNDYRDDGLEPFEAVTAGGMRRFRPILLTSLTTFFGLMPMIFETSIQARFLIPMALSLGFGVLFVTVIALVIVPSSYLALEDVRGLVQSVVAGGEESASTHDDTP